MAFITKYGFPMQREMSPLEVELFCYRWHASPKLKLTTTREEHFTNIVNFLWGPDNKKKHFQWNPWAEKARDVIHTHPVTGQPNPHVGLSGCASSGKSDIGAVYSIVNWLCDPLKTLVMVTSTDLQASRKRIWGAITEYWLYSPISLPGRLVESKGAIVTVDPRSGAKYSDKSGISLLAAEKKKERDAVGKIIGCKAERVILVADELPELSQAVTEAAFGNLTSNPFFQFIAMGNFKSWYDAFGELIKPKSGNLDSVTEDVDGYETEKGWCQIFDGLKSPNVLAGKDDWKGIYGSKQLKSHRADFGENSATFWRMCRSRPTPVGMDNSIYSESDFIAANTDIEPIWSTGFVNVSSLDPSYTNGGDRSVQWFGKYGQDITGSYVLHLTDYILLREDARKRDVTRNFQIAQQFVDNCRSRNVLPEHAAFDSTGAGNPFGDIVYELWRKVDEANYHKVLKVDFSGAVSQTQVSANSEKTADMLYDRRVTELWYVGVEFLKSRQLRGLPDELKREMKARKYTTVKGRDGLKVKVETKDDMKVRLNFSPDLADAFFILIDLCRQRLGFVAGGQSLAFTGRDKQWDEMVKRDDLVYSSVDYAPEEMAV